MSSLSCLRGSRHLFRLQLQKVEKSARISVPIQNLRTKSDVPPKPKAPHGGFMAYFNDIRPDMLKQNPGMKAMESGRLAGQKWQLLSEEEKRRYKPTEESMNNYKKALQQWKNTLTEEQVASIEEQKAKKRKFRLKKRLQVLGKPPKPAMSAFFCFVKSKPIQRGDTPITVYMQGLAQQWNKMEVNDREPFEVEAIKLKTDYFLKLDVWEKEMIKAGNYDLVRKTSLPSNIDRKTLKPKVTKRKAKKVLSKKSTKKTAKGKAKKGGASGSKKVTGKRATKKSAKASAAVEEDVSWMRAE